ncbi:MAG: YceD family protein [Bacillota bacterium]
MIELNVSGVKNSPGGKVRFEKKADLDPIQTEVEAIYFNGSLELDITLFNNDGPLIMTGNLRGNIRIACGRCLEYFDMPVEAEISEVYYNESMPDIRPEEGEEWIPFRGDRIDITPEVIKSLLASIPMRPVCREDCRGLCQNCGVNLNMSACDCAKDDIDIRLEALKKLIEVKKDEE